MTEHLTPGDLDRAAALPPSERAVPVAEDTTLNEMAVVQNGFENCLRLANAAREAGAIPIFWTSFPTNGRTAAQDAPRQWLNATLRGLRSNGWLVADFDAAISNGGNPASILPAFDSGDGLHLNDAGYRAMAAAGEEPVAYRGKLAL